MKNSTFLIILLSLGLLFVTWKWVKSGDNVSSPKQENSTIQDIMTRTSVRSYTDKEVTQEQTDTLLRAAMAAPTAANKQPWRIVVVNDRELLKTISEDMEWMKQAAGASLAMVLCGDVSAALEGEGRDFWIQDVSAASENVLLAAHSMGLGAVWCGIYPAMARVDIFKKLLHLPENIIPMSCICIGYPEGETVTKDKWHPEYVHYNSWENSYQ